MKSGNVNRRENLGRAPPLKMCLSSLKQYLVRERADSTWSESASSTGSRAQMEVKGFFFFLTFITIPFFVHFYLICSSHKIQSTKNTALSTKKSIKYSRRIKCDHSHATNCRKNSPKEGIWQFGFTAANVITRKVSAWGLIICLLRTWTCMTTCEFLPETQEQ